MAAKNMRSKLFILAGLCSASLCLITCMRKDKTSTDAAATSLPSIGKIVRHNPVLSSRLIPDSARLEVLGEGFEWSEGPVWIASEQMVLFSDIPVNTIYKWTEKNGIEQYLKPSGYTGQTPRGGETGSNGLTLDKQGRLILCQHGDRRVARLNAAWDHPEPQYTPVVDRWQGKRFNSPNDVIVDSRGRILFTDPPYGLERLTDDPARELSFQGVYIFDEAGQLSLFTDELSRPNGLAFSPDEKILYVANSDPEQAIWMAYTVDADLGITEKKVFYDATAMVSSAKGLPDGLKVHPQGFIFATGPGGVLVFTPQAELIATIETGEATANCAFDDNFSTLYITADMYLLRLKLK